LSRKYNPQTKTQAKLATPRTTKEPRQDNAMINQATRGGVIAFPIRAQECVKPCAKPRLEGDVQFDIARVAAGNPVRTVALAQMRPHSKSVRRAPKRSPSHPPMIWNTRYGYAKAEKTNPS
jgi:hypothetical protein